MQDSPVEGTPKINDGPIEQQRQEVNLRPIWLNFTINMWALWEFCEQLSQIADRYDEKKFQNTVRDIAHITGEEVAIIEPIFRKYLDGLPNAEYDRDENLEEEYQEVVGLIQSGELERIFLNLKSRHREKYEEFQKWWLLYTENPPTNGPTLRQSSLALLVSCFDFLVDSLAVTFNQSSTSVSTKTPIGIKFGKSYLTDLKGNVSSIEALAELEHDRMEINARRNLFMHNNGVIDQGYLNSSGRKDETHLIGKKFIVSVNYINSAIETIFIYGAILTYCCWVDWRPDQKKEADEALNHLLYTALLHKKYMMVIQLVETRKKMRRFFDIPKVVLVNQAIAYRKLKHEEKVSSIVSELKKDQSDQLINLAVAIMLRNDAKVKSLTQNCFAQNLGDHIQISWPLFDEYRKKGWFLRAISNKSSLPKSKRR